MIVHSVSPFINSKQITKYDSKDTAKAQNQNTKGTKCKQIIEHLPQPPYALVSYFKNNILCKTVPGTKVLTYYKNCHFCTIYSNKKLPGTVKLRLSLVVYVAYKSTNVKTHPSCLNSSCRIAASISSLHF